MKTPLQPFLNYLAHQKRYSSQTVMAYETDLWQFDAYLHADQEEWSAQQLLQAGYPEMRAWIIGCIDQGLAPATINRKIAALTAFYSFLERQGAIAGNPTLRLLRLKVPKNLPQFVPVDELHRILDQTVFGNDLEGQRDRLVLELLYGAGLRRAELMGLHRNNIDFSRGLLRVNGKGDKLRLVPLTHRLLQLLDHYISDHQIGHGPLIQTKSGKPAYPMLIQRIVKKYLGTAQGLDRKSPHALRHSFATHLLDQGADLGAIKELLGHESLSSTQVYTHSALSRLKAVFDKSHPRSGQ